MKRQTLGRGLDALLGEMDEAYENEASDRNEIIEIPLKDIRPNPFQPRKTFEEEALQELADSIKEDGLLQPIVVTEDIDGYVLIAGERRFRATKLAKLKEIKAIVFNSDEQKMRKFALIENIQREELNAIELAKAYSELIKLHEATHEELSNIIHKSRTHITNTLRLLQLSSKTQKALLDKKISAGHAKILVGFDEKEQQLLVNSIVGQKLSVRELESIVKSRKVIDEREEEQEKPAVHYNFDLLKSRFEDLGIKIKTSNTKLTLEFSSQNEIEEFMSHLRD